MEHSQKIGTITLIAYSSNLGALSACEQVIGISCEHKYSRGEFLFTAHTYLKVMEES